MAGNQAQKVGKVQGAKAKLVAKAVQYHPLSRLVSDKALEKSALALLSMSKACLAEKKYAPALKRISDAIALLESLPQSEKISIIIANAYADRALQYARQFDPSAQEDYDRAVDLMQKLPDGKDMLNRLNRACLEDGKDLFIKLQHSLGGVDYRNCSGPKNDDPAYLQKFMPK
ncbi:MAG: hypothetical protein WC717_02675 [Candidatus Micrarchaeia archaeon]|jgi:tetratricopeptide (TPR) repeat protein